MTTRINIPCAALPGGAGPRPPRVEAALRRGLDARATWPPYPPSAGGRSRPAVSVTVSAALAAELDGEASLRGWRRSEVIRAALAAGAGANPAEVVHYGKV